MSSEDFASKALLPRSKEERPFEKRRRAHIVRNAHSEWITRVNKRIVYKVVLQNGKSFNPIPGKGGHYGPDD